MKQKNKFSRERTISKKKKYKTNLKVAVKIRKEIYSKINKNNIVKIHS